MADAKGLVAAIAILVVGTYVLLVATGSTWTCGSPEGCAAPNDRWEPWRLGFALLTLAAGSSLILTSLWDR